MTVTQADIDERLDLRDEPIFTVDSADAKDLDDAISVKRTENGYKLGVHIADVSHYVKAKTPIDLEAYRRAAAFYFDGAEVKMTLTIQLEPAQVESHDIVIDLADFL